MISTLLPLLSERRLSEGVSPSQRRSIDNLFAVLPTKEGGEFEAYQEDVSFLRKGRKDHLRQLADHVEEIHSLMGGDTMLYRACEKGFLDVVAYLLERSSLNRDWLAREAVYPSLREGEKEPLIHVACRSESVENRLRLVDLLIRNGADVNAINPDGQTPLHVVLSSDETDETDETDEVSSFGDESDETESTLSPNPSSHLLDMVSYLVEKGADVTIEDGFYETPIQIATQRFGKESQVYRLLQGR